MSWGGKWSPERLMQFSYYTWTTAFLPRYSWETVFMSHSTQQFTGFHGGKLANKRDIGFWQFPQVISEFGEPFQSIA